MTSLSNVKTLISNCRKALSASAYSAGDGIEGIDGGEGAAI